MKIIVWIVALSALASTLSSADAANGDTRIHVSYNTKIVRVKPTPGIGGTGVDFQIILRADGSVEDSFLTGSGNGSRAKRKLGGLTKGVTYNVLNSETIVRKADAGTHFHILTVKVAGKNCSATSEYILKPGEKIFCEKQHKKGTTVCWSSITTDTPACFIQ